MYLRTSESFANDEKALRPIIEVVDDILVTSEDPALREDTIAALSKQSAARVRTTLKGCVERGILVANSVATCVVCGFANELEGINLPAYCASCEGTQFQENLTTVYHLSSTGRDERSRALSGFSTIEWPEKVGDYKGKVDALIISITQEEFGALLKRVGADGPVISGKREWNMRRVWSEVAKRNYLVACVRANVQGNIESHAVTRDAIDDFLPKSVLIVGTAGAVPGDLTLGDVVFGQYVHNMTLHETAADGTRNFSISGDRVPGAASNVLSNLQVTLSPWLSTVALHPLPAINPASKIVGDGATRRKIRAALTKRFGTPPRAPSTPYFTNGQIASSDGLIKSTELVGQWKKMAKHILAVEMESAGALSAARDVCAAIPIRAISDVVGLERDDAWTEYACDAAAAFAVAFIQSWKTIPGVK